MRKVIIAVFALTLSMGFLASCATSKAGSGCPAYGSYPNRRGR
ncbi:MAG: hypothetical protein ACKOW2_08245 [Sphingobacteriaceae bacterium]